MVKSVPSISFLTITYNPNKSVFERSLSSIALQDYPKDKIEHIVVDGGSNSEILKLAKKYNCRIIKRTDLKDSGEARMAVAIREAKNEIIAWFASDNILPTADSLKKFIAPFLYDSKLLASYSLHYAYNKKSSLLDRYCALFGVSDPVVFYLDKADRRTWMENKFEVGNKISATKEFDIVEFNEKNLPTVGANGFFTKRKVLLKAEVSEKQYVHIDVYIDLIKKGYRRFAIVNSASIEHIIGKSFLGLISRRIRYAKEYTFSDFAKRRRYSVFNVRYKKDWFNIFKFVFFTITIFQPFLIAARGFLKIRDVAWFLHPFMCWLFLIYYMRFTSFSLLKLKFNKKL